MRRKRARKAHGFLVVTSLMLCVVLLLLGMGFMESQASRYRSVVYAGQGSQARALAWAGLEDARLKMQNDVSFPPQYTGSYDPLSGYSFATQDQSVFSYMENVTLSSNVQGSYSVVINTTYGVDPFDVYEVDSVGILGDPNQPTALYHLQGEVDMSEDPARKFCRYTHVQDFSCP